MDQRPPIIPGLAGLAGLFPQAGTATSIPGFAGLAGAGAATTGARSTHPRAHRDHTDEMISVIENNIYRDNARLTPADVEAELRTKRVSSRKEPTFPMKLHKLLSDPDAEGIITWLPHGRAWKIIKQDTFESMLLPRYFEHSNISSFMRQVNGWDFRRVAKGTDEQSYYHERFLRGMPHLCKMMTRSKKSKKKDGALCSPKLLSITPDFYSMEPLPEEGAEPAAAPAAAAAPSDGDDKKKEGTKDDDASAGSGSKSPAQSAAAAPPGLPAGLTSDMLQRYAQLNAASMPGAGAPGAPNLQLFGQAQDIQARLNLLNSMRMMQGAPPALLSQFGGGSLPPPAAAAAAAPGAAAPASSSSSAAAPGAAPSVNDPNVSALLLELARSRGQI